MNLIDLKPSLDDLVDSFANVLDLEFTILNANPIIRISGTGNYKNYGWMSSNYNFTSQVITSGKPIVVLDTLNYNFGIAKDNPEYYSILLYPIILDEQIEGVLVLASFNEKQQNTIINKQTKLMNYLSKTASLISAKLEQERLVKRVTVMNNQLSSVFESVNSGLLLYDKEKYILQINNKAKKMLNYDDKQLFLNFSTPIIKIAEESIFKQQNLERDIHISLKDKNYSFIIKTFLVKDSKDNVLCTIEKFLDVQNSITQNEFNNIKVEIVTYNSQMLKIKDKVLQAAKGTSNILLLGESGTGKELFARTIHESSLRKMHPFVTVNCAAIPESLLESEFFGYEEGAFTGAKKGGKIGKFMLANQGTLFLDEIGDMPLYMQAKLLRVLSDKKVDRIGSTTSVEVDVRIISATNKNLEEMIAEKQFREDLYYRLSVIPVNIPPLRDRKDDIPLLIEYFINKYNKKLSKDIVGVSDEVFGLLFNYNWPGNVRELENCIEYMVNFEDGNIIKIENIPQKLLNNELSHCNSSPLKIYDSYLSEGKSLTELTKEFHKDVIKLMNAEYGGNPSLDNIKGICSKLNISVASYYRKVN